MPNIVKKPYGLVTPGYEQADVLAYNLNGGRAQYSGSTATTSLKVLDYPVYSMGEVDLPTHSHEEIRFQDHQKGIYRRLFIVHGRLRGVVAIGAWPGIERMQEMLARQQRIWPWQVRKFKKTGALWTEDDACNVVSWPNGAVICQCMGITRGDLALANRSGARTVDELAQMTGASTVCSACRPLLANFISVQPATKSEKLARGILVAAITGLVILTYVLYSRAGSELESYRGLYVLLTLCGLILGGVLLREVFRISRIS